MSTTKTLLLLAVIAVSIALTSCQKNEMSFTSDPPDLSAVNHAFTATPPPDYTDVPGTSTLKAAALRIEAESYTRMSGVQVENCREGGKNVGYIHAGDWMEYSVDVGSSGNQTVSFRVAGPGGSIQLKKADGTVLGSVTLPRTAGGQVYATGSATVNLPAGKQTLRIQSQSAGWNFNWFELANNGASSSPGTSNPSNPSTPSTPPGNGANLLLASTFEAAADLKKWEKEVCRSGALQLSTDVARKGSYSARFEFAKNDVLWYNYIRAEIRQKSYRDAEQWFGFSNYLPGDFVTDPLAEKIAQWHDVPDFGLGETWRSPPISFGIQNGRYYLNVMWASKAVNTTLTRDGEKRIDLGPVDKMKWNDWVFHIKFSYKSDGILEVWKNKVKVFTLYGPNSFNDLSYPYLKIGIYKWGWDGWASYSPADKRVLYYDEVRIGNHNANINDVSPQ